MIPKVVYQTWKTKQLPKQYEIILDHNKSLNPEYQFILLDDDDYLILQTRKI
jgi:mannosyltransferase OCH1-like enzyme